MTACDHAVPRSQSTRLKGPGPIDHQAVAGGGMTLFDANVDANVDGTVNNGDIPDFVTALLNVADWQTLHPGLDPRD